MAKSESTGKKVASTASKILHCKTATKAEKSVAASALTQSRSKTEVTGKAVASIMADPKSSRAAKSVAASALTQKTKKKQAF